jgi:two-component system sensor histidine kinase MtrB
MSFFRRLLRLANLRWRQSLRLRMVAASGILSAVAIGIIGGFLSYTIQVNLYDSRRDEILAETTAVSRNIQTLFDGALDVQGSIDVEQANAAAQTTVRSTTNSPGLAGFAILRVPGQATEQIMASSSSIDFPVDIVSTELREAIQQDRASVLYQPVEMPDGQPGIAAGTNVNVPTAGRYDLVLVYDLNDVQENLRFVQGVLLVGGGLFVLITTFIVWSVTTRSIRPIVTTAQTAERFAEGNLDERIDVEGEDIAATLATSFNKMAESIHNQITRLATLTSLQQQFVSDVSHELRTPLTSIKLAGSMLYDKRSTFDADTQRAAELLKAQIDKFEVTLAELLELSRFDAGAAELELESTTPATLVTASIEAVQPLADAKGTVMRVHAPGGHSEFTLDPRRFRRIMQNLLSNAIDHGEGKPIDIWVDSSSTALGIAVRDYGVGMSQDEAARVFDRFWRADSSRQRQTGGTGLGLAIAQEDARLHGGWIDTWSIPGEGACFRLTLPRDGALNVDSPLPLPPEVPNEG